MSEQETVIGVDFSGTRLARDQRRKIIALAAVREEAGRYTLTPHGFKGWCLTKIANFTAALRWDAVGLKPRLKASPQSPPSRTGEVRLRS